MFQTTWAGDCSAWECDELGHLNMSFYLDKFEQARMGLFVRLGLHEAFRTGAISTVRSRDIHIKYLAEARPGSPLRIESAIIALHDTTAEVGHVMYHRDGRMAATLREIVEHVYIPEDKKFAWPSRLKLKAAEHMDQLPAPARARNLSLDWELKSPAASELDYLGAADIGSGMFLPADTMPAGHVPFSKIFRRITTTLGWYSGGWPEFSDPDYIANGGSAVVLEIRVHMPNLLRAGDIYHMRPAIVDANPYTRLIMHNILNTLTGECVVAGYAAAGLFDLNARKLTKATDEQIGALMQAGIPSLAPPSTR
ncbi:thioesterase [Algimonas arctica]|uniref:Thioesterase n=1 Tax=Algimonas arctica TaxID=1479486 RepID=A0A8J3CRG4_9PROT|nr:thioesterase family protein [Algimonas arctica]GHA88437.1 thioesterase [Algimonas arctica]